MRTWQALILITLAGCETVGKQPERFVPARPITRIVGDTLVGTAEGAWQAVQAPFEDLNIKRQPIPEKLKQVVINPYAVPPQFTCDGIRIEIMELDILLGPDSCTPANPTGVVVSRKGEYIDQGVGFASDYAVGMVRGKVDIIPLRGVVRKVTGAEKHAKEVARAYEAGKARRSFLKGLEASLGPACLNAPMPELPEQLTKKADTTAKLESEPKPYPSPKTQSIVQ